MKIVIVICVLLFSVVSVQTNAMIFDVENNGCIMDVRAWSIGASYGEKDMDWDPYNTDLDSDDQDQGNLTGTYYPLEDPDDYGVFWGTLYFEVRQSPSGVPSGRTYRAELTWNPEDWSSEGYGWEFSEFPCDAPLTSTYDQTEAFSTYTGTNSVQTSIEITYFGRVQDEYGYSQDRRRVMMLQ